MRAYMTGLILLGFASLAYAKPLTPPHEPKDDSFYVCYESCRVFHSTRAPLATYRKFKYLGCSISRTPCHVSCIKKTNCPPVKLKLFGWFNNYPQSLNAFYRCAYTPRGESS